MIHRYQKCIGVTLWRWFRHQWILWLCPQGQTIPAHSHSDIDARIVFLGGKMRWHRDGQERACGWRDMFRAFRVPPGVCHGATALESFGLFLVMEKWLPGKAVTSAAVNFELR